MPGDFESFDTYVDEITPESLFEERKRVSFANLVGAISSIPLAYFCLAVFARVIWHARPRGGDKLAGLLMLAVILSLCASARGSRWWLLTALLSLALCLFIVLH
jgi:hypothetical protein